MSKKPKLVRKEITDNQFTPVTLVERFYRKRGERLGLIRKDPVSELPDLKLFSSEDLPTFGI